MFKQAKNLCIAAWDFENISKLLKSFKNLEIFLYSFENNENAYVIYERSWIVLTNL